MLYFSLAILFIAFVIYVIRLRSELPKQQDGAALKYQYQAKPYTMTQAEVTFFKQLEQAAGERYYVFPQIHLDSLLNHKVKGQNWSAALSTIQRKSVDFILVDKQTMRTMYAIELDDSTHDSDKRQKRDRLVESILKQANVPLVRFRNIDTLSSQDIIGALSTHYGSQE